MRSEGAWFDTTFEGERLHFAAGGHWRLDAVAELDPALRELDARAARHATVDLSAVESLDTAGAWALHRIGCRLRDRGIATEYRGLSPQQEALFEQLAACPDPVPTALEVPNPVLVLLERTGRGALAALAEAQALLAFLGLVAVTAGRALRRPGRIRLTSLFAHIERTGLDALPIVGLLSFLIGIVLAYQGADQLRRFGAEIFTVNLLGVSVLREIAVLLTAILVAGRSGSAFTAQIGTMKVNQEVDAMWTLSLDPIEVLVLPRLLALTLVMPLLAFYADIMGLFGGAVMAMAVLDMSPAQFLRQLNEAVPIWSFWVGLVKAPVFGIIIALTGCYQGLKVAGSADSVGRMTTQSVVESIFLVIVFDALFSIMFSYLGI